MNKLPGESAKNTGSSGGRRSVNIYGNVNLSSNDIAELRKLADSHPELAQQIATDRRAIAISDQRTERLGMILAVVFGCALIGGTSWTLVNLGWWQSIMFVASLLGISHILRTFLKGEFSDTPWFGKIMSHSPKPGEKADH
ncbi:MAG: hypothetical protein ACU0CQ_00805 [Sulfitobacter sp.]|uniref:hypothetical protein n=1 Tax=Sulfitobacter sp. TaxID=1903071 RepID=UPI00405A3F69